MLPCNHKFHPDCVGAVGVGPDCVGARRVPARRVVRGRIDRCIARGDESIDVSDGGGRWAAREHWRGSDESEEKKRGS